MIGTSISINLCPGKRPDTAILKKESWHKVRDVVNDNFLNIAYSYHDSYLVTEWWADDSLILFEGCIFNLSPEEISAELNAIASSNNVDDIKKKVASFVQTADGDFLITIYMSSVKRLIVFNDLLGGMAVHYAHSKTSLQISRSLTYVVVNSNCTYKLSPNNLSEFLIFGHNIGDHTFFENIKKFTPGTCIIANFNDEDIIVEKFDTVKPDFTLKNQFTSKQEAINVLSKLFLNSCKLRVEYAKKNGYEIVNTMSGGFDSRTILGGIEKYEKSYLNLTYQYKQDESEVAKKVLKHLDSKSEYVKLSYENIPNIEDSSLAFKTDGKIESYTNSICYNDLIYGRNNYLKNQKVFYFGGFGGEYIRHPLKPFIQSPKQWGMSFSPSVKLVANLFNASINGLNSSINEVNKPYYINGHEVVAKFFYNEYYQNLVRCSGEERMRLFYYTVQPMMSKDFILAIRNRVPLKWAGFRFYSDFLKEIDKRLVEVELFGSAVNIKSRFSLSKIDLRKNMPLFSYVRYLQRRFTNWEYKAKPISVSFSIIDSFYNKISDKSFLNYDYLKTVYRCLGGVAQLRLLTVIEFIYECECYMKKEE